MANKTSHWYNVNFAATNRLTLLMMSLPTSGTSINALNQQTKATLVQKILQMSFRWVQVPRKRIESSLVGWTFYSLGHSYCFTSRNQGTGKSTTSSKGIWQLNVVHSLDANSPRAASSNHQARTWCETQQVMFLFSYASALNAMGTYPFPRLLNLQCAFIPCIWSELFCSFF